MAAAVTIVYDDGHSDEVSLKAIDLVKAERHFKGALPGVEGTLYAAWQKLRPGVKFDDWLETVDHMDSGDDVEGEGPSREEPSPDQ